MQESVVAVSPHWHGPKLLATCASEVVAAKARDFPSGSVRRDQNRKIGVVPTPFGAMELSVWKDPFTSDAIECCVYTGVLLGEHEDYRGDARFTYYKRAKGYDWLSDRGLRLCMDAHSEDAIALYELLASETGNDAAMDFNMEGLLFADRVRIAPEYRGSAAWKALYFCTMSAVFAHQKRCCEHFTFFAHPFLSQEDNAPDDPAKLAQGARDLRRFYAVHLDAKVIRTAAGPTGYMRAPVPDAIWTAFAP